MRAFHIVGSPRFEKVIMGAIVCNTLTMTLTYHNQPQALAGRRLAVAVVRSIAVIGVVGWPCDDHTTTVQRPCNDHVTTM